ncbi:Uncharacterized protein DBV15_04613 [Temnothorax longispinosus]|uniref:Aminopeptidase P N-terminal domain-containing protein n=1 Tax=Temnothorax longispinosus TaxID=300112 RepID=A0A4S2KXX7_9HYME|nr:Uncharacterized protein DBV15_04613 [Temnothorax longispinosus]
MADSDSFETIESTDGSTPSLDSETEFVERKEGSPSSSCNMASHFWRHGETLKVPMSLFHKNRQRLVTRLQTKTGRVHPLPDFYVILQGGVEVPFNDTDINWPFRQESYFQWAFGVEEPGCYGAIELAKGTSLLFVPRLSPEYAIWQGKLHTLDDFKERYAVDEVYYTDEIGSMLLKKDAKYMLLLVSRVWEQMDAHWARSAFLSAFSSSRGEFSVWGIIRI